MKIINAKAFIDGEFRDLEVQFDDKVITNIGKDLPDNEIIDAKNMYLYPGMIDAHIHGGFNCSFYDNGLGDYSNGEKQIREICRRLPHYGVTSCLPTLGADSSTEALAKVVRLIRNIRKDIEGADPFKFHYEGPYLNPEYKASFHTSKYMISPTREHTLQMTDGDLSDVEIICIAPELPGALEWIEWMTAQGVKTEICYTKADSSLVREAADRGLNQISHLYNGFQPMHQRINGPVVGCLLDDRINAQLTCDGFHVAADWIRLAIKAKGIQKCYGITDMISLAGLPDGKHDIPNLGAIYVKDGQLKNEHGTICGGNMTWNAIMKAARDCVGLSMEQVGIIYGENPAKCLGITDRGKIEVGRRSDLVIMDHDYNVFQTIILGKTYI